MRLLLVLAIGSLFAGACRLPTAESCANMSRMEDVLFCTGMTAELKNTSSNPKECQGECPRGQVCDRETGECEPAAPADPRRAK